MPSTRISASATRMRVERLGARSCHGRSAWRSSSRSRAARGSPPRRGCRPARRGRPACASRVMRPGDGAKVSGSSALMRHSKAWPWQAMSAWVSASRSPRATRMLLLHDVDAGGHFGHRMLDLQPRVHLDEVESALLVQELEGAHAAVADAAGRPPRSARPPRRPAPRRCRAPALPRPPSDGAAAASSPGCRARSRGRGCRPAPGSPHAADAAGTSRCRSRDCRRRGVPPRGSGRWRRAARLPRAPRACRARRRRRRP